MSLRIPLYLNTTQIGDIEIVRRCDEGGCDRSKDPGRTFTYDWTVAKFQIGTTKRAPSIRSGNVSHQYDDGAFTLLTKVLNDYEAQERHQLSQVQ